MQGPPDPGESGHGSATNRGSSEPSGDPWAAFGYLVSGVLFYGAVGWGLSIWLHASYWIPIGILVGAGLGLYLVFARYGVRPGKTDPPGDGGADKRNTSAAREQRPPSDDRGETA
jgi:ATP synthase protein I